MLLPLRNVRRPSICSPLAIVIEQCGQRSASRSPAVRVEKCESASMGSPAESEDKNKSINTEYITERPIAE